MAKTGAKDKNRSERLKHGPRLQQELKIDVGG